MIKGNNITLKFIEESDTDNILKWRNKESVRKNFFIQELLTRETHLWWIKNKIKTGEVVQFIIIENSSKSPIGSVYLRDIDKKNKKAEYGIFIGEDNARGKGLGSEAAELICNYGFNNIGLHRIFLRVFKHNIQAIKSYEKVGFEIEGILKDDIFIDSKYYDVVIMSKIYL